MTNTTETTNTTATTMDTLSTALIALNGTKAANGNTDDQVKAIRKLINEENTLRSKAFAEVIVSTAKETNPESALTSFINNQFYQALILDFSEDTNEYSFKEVGKQLCFKTLSTIASKEKVKFVEDTFSSYISLFLHNIYLCKLDETKLDKETRNKLAISEMLQNVAKHNADGVFQGCSMNKLMLQIEKIFSMVLPEVKPLKADLRFCIDFLTKATISVDGAKVTIRNENTLYKALFITMYMRKNNLTYNVESQGDVHKVKADK